MSDAFGNYYSTLWYIPDDFTGKICFVFTIILLTVIGSDMVLYQVLRGCYQSHIFLSLRNFMFSFGKLVQL